MSGWAKHMKPSFLLGSLGALTLLNCMLLPDHFAPHVDVETVRQKPLPLLVRASGNLNPKDSNTVKIRFEAAVEKKLFREGQQVRRGELLLLLSRDRIRLDYQTKKDSLDNANADLVKARREVRLQTELYKKQAVAYSAVEDARASVIKAVQNVRSTQESFHEMQEIWNSAMVTAPLDGTIVKDWIGEDKMVAAGKELMTVADVSEFTVHARVDELDIRSVHEGQKAEITLPVFQSVKVPAVVTEIGTAPEGNGLLAVPVVLRITDSKGLLLLPKLTSEVTIFTGVTEPVLSVPTEAIANTDGETHVWTLDALHRLRSKEVELGRSNPDRVEIVKGLAAGDSVVTSAEPDFAAGIHVILGALPEDKQRSKTQALLQRLPKSHIPAAPKTNAKKIPPAPNP